MLSVISPAKKLNGTSLFPLREFSQPDFLEQSDQLVGYLRKLSRQELAHLMKISDKLAVLNVQRFADFHTPFDLGNAKQAVLSFAGDTYRGLKAETLQKDDLLYAQDHLRILSGLYGLLRPLDLMQPYRLEMGTRLENQRGNDLYAFWKDHIAPTINTILHGHKDRTLINLASQEYIKSVDLKALNFRMLTPVFKEIKNGQARIIGMKAKYARGAMARYIIANRLENAEDLKDFSEDGYMYDAAVSDENEWVFVRDPANKAR